MELILPVRLKERGCEWASVFLPATHPSGKFCRGFFPGGSPSQAGDQDGVLNSNVVSWIVPAGNDRSFAALRAAFAKGKLLVMSGPNEYVRLARFFMSVDEGFPLPPVQM